MHRLNKPKWAADDVKWSSHLVAENFDRVDWTCVEGMTDSYQQPKKETE